MGEAGIHTVKTRPLKSLGLLSSPKGRASATQGQRAESICSLKMNGVFLSKDDPK